MVELGEEHIDALLLILFLHTFDGEFHNVDRGERQITTSDRGLRSETVLKHTGTTAHRRHLMDIALGIVGTPVTILVVRGVEVQEVGEEPARCHLTSQLIEVEVTVLGQIVHTTLLLPDLDGEDGRLTITHTLIGGEQDLTHDTTTLGTRVSTIVNRGEHHLVTTTRVDGIHIVDKCLHRLVHTTHRLVDGMLLGTFLTRQSIEGFLQVVDQRLLIEILIALAIQLLQRLQLLDIGQSHIGGQIEVKGRDSLTTMHLVLTTLHRDTGQHRGRLNTLGRTRGTMTSHEAAVQDIVQRMLHTGERLGGIVVLIMDMQVVVFHSLTTLLTQQIVVDEGLRGLRGKLHHHTCRGVGIHIGILTCHIVVLDVHDIEEHLTGLGLTSHTTLMTVGDVLLGHVLSTRVHQLHLHSILNLFHGHLTIATLGNMVSNLIQESLVLTLIGVEHGLTNSSHYLLLVKAHNTSVTLYYCLNHSFKKFLVDAFSIPFAKIQRIIESLPKRKTILQLINVK